MKILESYAPDRAKRIFAQASVRSVGGRSVFAAGTRITSRNAREFRGSDVMVERAERELRRLGFEILHVGSISINIAGSVALFERAFGRRIVAQRVSVLGSGSRETETEMFTALGAATYGLIDVSRRRFGGALEGIAIEEPRRLMAPSATPPSVDYYHLNVPTDVASILGASRTQAKEVIGRGVSVVMIDTGWYDHPFFSAQGFSGSVVLGPGATTSTRDESGHGTGESANVFSVAPGVDFTMVKSTLVNTAGDFGVAVDLGPDIISCSWGSDKPTSLTSADLVLEALIADAVASGVTVVFSAGNGQFGFPGQHPDVISAGGVYRESDGDLRASDYASGFNSSIYPGRRVPDVSGLVGLQPAGIYIMLPVDPGQDIDRSLDGGSFPNKDETDNDDGWAVFSGTSAAAPQLAGVCALMKEFPFDFGPEVFRDFMMDTAIDVTTGSSNPATGGISATTGPDAATGAGLVDANDAAELAASFYVRNVHQLMMGRMV